MCSIAMYAEPSRRLNLRILLCLRCGSVGPQALLLVFDAAGNAPNICLCRIISAHRGVYDVVFPALPPHPDSGWCSAVLAPQLPRLLLRLPFSALCFLPWHCFTSRSAAPKCTIVTLESHRSSGHSAATSVEAATSGATSACPMCALVFRGVLI